MLKAMFAAVAVAAAVMVSPAGIKPAEAVPAVKPDVAKTSLKVDVRKRRGYRGFKRYRGRGFRRYRGVRRFHRGRRYGRRFYRHRRFRPYRYYYGVPYAGYYYGYGSSCRWLKRRAIITGSSYWWRRYHACRYGYYY